MADSLSRRITAAAVLLTLGTGATDVLSFTRLGGVFTSVMTGNLVLLGLAIARTSAVLAEHTATAVGGYVAGVMAAAALMALPPWSRRQDGDPWPPLVTAALVAEFALLAGVAAGWELTAEHPAGATAYLLLALAATGMGMQSAAVRGIDNGDFSTTYLTSTLISLAAALVTPSAPAWPGPRRPGALLALATGALISGLLLATVPALDPVITLGPLCLALTTRIGARRSAGTAHDGPAGDGTRPTA